ncbi:hypothetical protein [Maribacter sp. 2-571]|uniref:hypothetical protein n=1 Tax=Maribacter sp. 2-571 TaxID=3417569 RepID=UPI003D3496E4
MVQIEHPLTTEIRLLSKIVVLPALHRPQNGIELGFDTNRMAVTDQFVFDSLEYTFDRNVTIPVSTNIPPWKST